MSENYHKDKGVILTWLGSLEQWMSTWCWSQRNSLEHQLFAHSSCTTTERRTSIMRLWRWINKPTRSSSVLTSPLTSLLVALFAAHTHTHGGMRFELKTFCIFIIRLVVVDVLSMADTFYVLNFWCLDTCDFHFAETNLAKNK